MSKVTSRRSKKIDIETEERPKYGVVVMLDALGTRSLTLEDSLRFLKIRSKFLEVVEDRNRVVSEQRDGNQEEFNIPEIVTFGDTIILTWELPEKGVELYLPLFAEILRPSMLAGLRNGLLFRGALSIGHFVQSGATVIGPAIADAVSWYERADWFGVIATPNCSLRLSWLDEFRKTLNQPNLDLWYVQYDVPLTNGKSQKLWVVSWPAQFPPVEQQEGDKKMGPRELLFTLLRNSPVPAGTEQKYFNSIKFFDWYLNEIGGFIGMQENAQE